jgi:glycine/D-amino acid oxidase-like deaminating enzyme
LVKELSEMLKIPFTVEQHFAAIRPTVRDRKPYLGPHPKFPLLFIFNGLGAKGSSLGPYYATHFADYLEGEIELDKEVAISRLKPLK